MATIREEREDVGESSIALDLESSSLVVFLLRIRVRYIRQKNRTHGSDVWSWTSWKVCKKWGDL